ncbi:Peroxisome chaperone and import receptor [Tilletia horrida]|nr:Peroxisome chaperone and import receptor [Tilletia horrida]
MTEEEKKATTSSAPAPAPAVEEDLDDLDDVLDEFNKPSTTAKPIPAALSGSRPTEGSKDGKSDSATAGASSSNPASAATASSSSKSDPKPFSLADALAGDDDDLEGMPDLNEDELMKGFEEMMAAMGLGAPGAAGASSSSSSAGAPGAAGPSAPPADFAEAIKATMAKLRESDSNASKGGAGGAGGLGGLGADGMPSDEELARLFEALGSGAGGQGGEGEPELAKMLENMMGELLSKDILYEPLKELRDKYPPYFASPAAASISAEDKARYEAQHRFVTQVVTCFEDPLFDNGTEEQKQAKRAEVQELMDSMQECGQPPKEVVGDMPPELDSLGLGGNDENCCIM